VSKDFSFSSPASALVFGPCLQSVKSHGAFPKQGVCHTMALPFTLKSILRQKTNHGKLNYFAMRKNTILKNPVKETKMLQDIITL
jgi:hypothetical protein